MNPPSDVIPPVGPPLIVVMGVTSSGKSTVGEQVADELRIPFVDGDSLHPESNVAKMASGVPLTDDDRWPWLRAVGDAMRIARRNRTGMVMACSALKRSYRDAIRNTAGEVLFVELHGSRELLAQRSSQRKGHFMPTSLLDSQLATLESLAPDEHGVILDIARTVDDLTRAICDLVVAQPGSE